MHRELLKSKIHRATVTDANLNYEGSITIDSELMKAANLAVFEKVSVVNINNGNRFDTYVIEGGPGSGEICVNGAAARLVHTGDLIIIMSYASMPDEAVTAHRPVIILVDAKNRPVAN